MSAQHSPSSESPGAEDNRRKRVCKACDRCRMKKSKCDGNSPCQRCKSDNTICKFGERKKAQDKVYPKGYVEMLEEQQKQLVAGLQQLYRRARDGEGWPGSPLREFNGRPLTHDILEGLGVLKDGEVGDEHFEDDLSVLQQRLLASGSGVMRRRDSSDASSNGDASPTFTKSMHGGAPFSATNMPPTPPNYSPYSRSQQITTQANISPTLPQQSASIPHPHAQASEFQASFAQRQAFFGAPAIAVPRHPSWDQVHGNGLDIGPPGLIHGFDPPLSGDSMDYFQRPAASISTTLTHGPIGPLHGQTEWIDEEFQKLFNPSPV
ncbi:hypothetical protein D8B26_001218 [Coccidioides posadasii str. Silveira]|uniref:C6 transcription factor n=2 Tax=Coccidioides posadasii TaxID=199306 RepID=E9DA97_COCPS|nr:Fungal Zn binuclear cluster domain containing protein [Coccidioides posadasii C735 delta SOWgp]EER23144.1 Fungal Zn binuclear cluster domain containing protein [Coccidioides posadasii C735 delta SOWgp]EFW16828.1 C6 transcription factor [Coccidioides posadasii str. Silveira]QVM06510.1 hypothetical protein D8B26_001218 [Coccidioides posadasii str. Silveira]|eukprot:XP_003065289.1 Fungal Zn binuclear cluster domain containing protein [Coccidioides posadasii C735 delta SOWgp]